MKPINITPGRPDAYDAHPSLVRAGERLWVAWCALEGRRDEIRLRSFDPATGDLSPAHQISGDTSANTPPQLAATDSGLAVVWAACESGEWSVWARHVALDGAMSEPLLVAQDAWQPAAMWSGQLWIAWTDTVTKRIHCWSESAGDEILSGGGAQRPALGSWVFGDAIVWDQYSDGMFRVFARRWDCDDGWSDAERLSDGATWSTLPTVEGDLDGWLHCAWVQSADVIDPDGVIDQWGSLHCMTFTEKTGWAPAGPGETRKSADICHSLLAREQIWGYNGRRRAPMVREDWEGLPWLLWERKVDPDAPVSQGELLALPFEAAPWAKPRRLAQGHVYYAPECSTTRGMDVWVASRPPKDRNAWDIYLQQVPLCTGDRETPEKDLVDPSTDDWARWTPITLPTSKVEAPEGLYFGDVHAHSALSTDAEGEPDEFMRYARDKAQLDFVAMIDNDCYQCPMMAHEFETSMTVADAFNRDHEFITLPGFEWTLWDKENCSHPDHRTVLLPHARELIRHTDPGEPTTEQMAARIAELGGILFTQHWDWTLTDSPAETALEVTSAWDYYIDKPEPFHRDLLAGRRLGFVGGSDSHRRNPGLCGALTGVYAEELTREGIFEAIRARRMYATSGSKMVLDVRLNGAPMGSEITCDDTATLTVIARGTRPLTRLEVWRGSCETGQVGIAHEAELSDHEEAVEWADPTPATGVSFYYVTVHQEGQDKMLPSNLARADGCRAWSSPIWVTRS